MKLKNSVKLIKIDNLYTLTNSEGASVVVKEKDLWLVSKLLKEGVAIDDALTMICTYMKEKEVWASFTLAQFIIDYSDYLENEE